MGYSVRYFIVNPSGEIGKYSNRKYSALFKTGALAPELSGRTVKFIVVTVESRNKTPVQIHEIDGVLIEFDLNGSPAKAISEITRLSISMIPSINLDPTVLSIADGIARNKMQKLKWMPSTDDIKAVTSCIFSKKKKKSRKIIPIKVATAAERTDDKMEDSDMFDDYKDLETIKRAISTINGIVTGGSCQFIDKAFRSVSTNAIPKAESEVEKLLWHGVKSALKYERERGKVWESGEGEWVAVAYLFKWDDWRKNSGGSDILESVVCKNKGDAVSAAKKMTVKYSMKVDELSYLEPEVMPIADWQEIEKNRIK